MGHTVPDSLIYLFLNLVSHDADAFSSAFPNIDIFITLKGKSIICFVLLCVTEYRSFYFPYKYISLIYIPLADID